MEDLTVKEAEARARKKQLEELIDEFPELQKHRSSLEWLYDVR